jgi:hypothetical protein
MGDCGETGGVIVFAARRKGLVGQIWPEMFGEVGVQRRERNAGEFVQKMSTYKSRCWGALCESHELSGESGVLRGG